MTWYKPFLRRSATNRAVWAEISASVYIICVQLPSRLGMQLNLRLRSLYVLLLCLYVPYTYCYYSCNETHPAPGAPRGASTCSRWRPDELHGCRLCTSDARRIRDLDKSITSFYPRLRLEFMYPLFQQRSARWRQTVRGSITSDTNMSFKQLCSRVAAIAGPWNYVVYGDIRLLKAHSSFSGNCMGDAAPKRSSGCGFVLTNLRHISARGYLRNVYT